MAKEYAESFYNGSRWRRASKGYLSSKHYICEQCGQPASICHHVIHITPVNIHDPNITLNWDNMRAMCHDCHTRLHMSKPVCAEGLKFDSNGDIIQDHR